MNIDDEKKKEIYLLKHKFYEQDNEKLTDDSVIKCGKFDFSKSKKIAYQTIFDISEYNRLIDNGNGNKNLSSALKVHICLKCHNNNINDENIQNNIKEKFKCFCNIQSIGDEKYIEFNYITINCIQFVY